MKIKRYRKINFSFLQSIGFFFLVIVVLSILLFKQFNHKITPKLMQVADASINKFNETILTNYRVKNIYKEVSLDDAIHVVKNNKDEIITVDFNLERVYEALSVITQYLQNSLDDEKVRSEILNYYNNDMSLELNGIVLSLPIGVASDEIYLANLGPRIPVMIKYLGYVSSSVRIKLEDYGINNALVSVYIDCSITNEFIVPSSSNKVNHEYSILIASKIIQGIVPEYYGGVLETKSNILNVPFK